MGGLHILGTCWRHRDSGEDVKPGGQFALAIYSKTRSIRMEDREANLHERVEALQRGPAGIRRGIILAKLCAVEPMTAISDFRGSG